MTQGTSEGWPDRSSENVLAPEPEAEAAPVPEAEPEPEPSPSPSRAAGARGGSGGGARARAEPEPRAEHAAGDIEIPDDVDVLEGEAGPTRRLVAVVVSKFNGDITTQLLESAFAELDAIGVARSQLTVVPVPGAFELPIAAMALAKTRRYLCVIALGCVIRGETPHFDYVASEAASGLQLAGLETGIPVSFGVLTCDTREQAEARVSQGRRCRARRARDGRSLLAASNCRSGLAPPGYTGRPMSKVCAICGKKPSFGHNRSHSMVATKRRFDPNLQRVRVLLHGKPTRAYVCTRCLKGGKVTKAI